MKKTVLLIIFLMSNHIFSQQFEGRIIYKNSFEKIDKMNSFDLNKFLNFMGDKSEFITKKGSYKIITNGYFKPYQLYNASNPILFYKDKLESDTLYFVDYRKFADYDIESEIEKNSDTILGYTCDKLTVTSPQSDTVMNYYFAPDLKQNSKYYKGYKHDGMNKIMEITKSVILRYESLGGGMKITREAIKIEKLKISDNEFEIPKDKVLIEKSQ